jgi:hypothetical protein
MTPRERMQAGEDARPEKPSATLRAGIERQTLGRKPAEIELYSTTLSHTMPLENAPDDGIDFVAEFDSIEQAAEYADANGCGWYLWSKPCHGRYLGSICVMQGSKPEIREF